MLVTCAPDVFSYRKYLFGFSKCVCKDAQEIQKVLNQGMSHFIYPAGHAQVSLRNGRYVLGDRKGMPRLFTKWS